MGLIKICGITTIEDTWMCIDAGADALGFNFYPKSTRYLEPVKALKLFEDIPPSILKVGVFVNEDPELVRDLSVDLGLDYLQFHGTETPSYCEQFATPYWKGIPLKDESSLEEMPRYQNTEAFLVDTYAGPVFGGSGVTGNWDLARQSLKYGKIILAGGLTPDNVSLAIQTVQPYGVDVASGVERNPGQKDPDKVEKFISEARSSFKVPL